MVENTDTRDVNLARWVFPLYLALARFRHPHRPGRPVALPGGVLPDSFVISLPLAQERPWLALLAFLGGASAATAW